MSAIEGASKYLNNLLLARGLLQHGKPINFAHPGDGTEGTDATMSKIINLVHDLVLRRDREAEQHEAIVTTIRNMRVEESQRLLDFQRMQDKSIQLKNKATAAEAQERALRGDMRRLEMQIKELKEQALKMKSLMDQARAKCVGDVKKRDTEIEKLKGHIAGLQRGKREASGARSNVGNVSAAIERGGRSGTDSNSKDWSLEKETHDLLSAVINETTSENVSLRKLVNETIETLKNLTGLEEEEPKPEEKDGIGIPGQYRKSRQVAAEIGQADSLVSCQALREQLQTVLEHCRSILKDPSFVPIEEVQIREEEIVKLRAGWERMADRWKEAVIMMGQWKRRMHEDGGPDTPEWSDLPFDRSVAVRPDGQPILGQENRACIDLGNSLQRSESEESVPFEDQSPENTLNSSEQDEESELDLEIERPRKRIASSPARRGVRIPRPAKPLSEVTGNSSRPDYASHDSTTCITSFSIESSENPENDTFHHRQARSKILKPPYVLTISEKLSAVEAEAAEAQKRSSHQETHKRKVSGRTGGSQRTSRRRSALSPQELAALLGSA